MSAAVHTAFSTPARRVAPVEPIEFTVMTFSRTLSDRNPHVRSSSVVVEPMPDAPRMHAADRLVVRVCSFAAAALVTILAAERFLP